MFWSIIGRDSSVSKTNRLHVDTIQFFYIQWLSLVKLELKLALAGGSRSLVVHASKCEHAMSNNV